MRPPRSSTFCSDSFVDIWATFIVQNTHPMKTPLPPEFHRVLAAKKAIDERKQEAQAVYNAVSQPKPQHAATIMKHQ